MYSYGIILQEIQLRNGPFYLRDRELRPDGKKCIMRETSLIEEFLKTHRNC